MKVIYNNFYDTRSLAEFYDTCYQTYRLSINIMYLYVNIYKNKTIYNVIMVINCYGSYYSLLFICDPITLPLLLVDLMYNLF